MNLRSPDKLALAPGIPLCEFVSEQDLNREPLESQLHFFKTGEVSIGAWGVLGSFSSLKEFESLCDKVELGGYHWGASEEDRPHRRSAFFHADNHVKEVSFARNQHGLPRYNPTVSILGALDIGTYYSAQKNLRFEPQKYLTDEVRARGVSRGTTNVVYGAMTRDLSREVDYNPYGDWQSPLGVAVIGDWRMRHRAAELDKEDIVGTTFFRQIIDLDVDNTREFIVEDWPEKL